MRYTDDPVADFHSYDAELEAELQKLPECDYCGETIRTDYFYLVNDDIICPGCMNKHFRKDVSEYVD